VPTIITVLIGLRGLEITFPPHEPSDAGSIPADGKIREQSPSEGTLSCLTRVGDLLHVKEPQVPKGNRWTKLRTFPSKKLTMSPPEGLVPLFSGRWN
jgi:hypothetical protein